MTGEIWVDGCLEQVSSERSDGSSVLILDGTHRGEGLCQGFAERGWTTWRSDAPLLRTQGLDLVVSFGYRHLIPAEVIASSPAPLVNLHTSYLPFNRGAHPGFWCFRDGSPCGVSVHVIDAGLDTGPLLGRRLVDVDPWNTTFDAAYWRLRESVESLFWDLLPPFLAGELRPRPQVGSGTMHRSTDLPRDFAGWDALIGPEVERLSELDAGSAARFRALIDEIEQVRRSNNVNWMDLLRLAFSEAPERARTIVRRINSDDQRISDLLDALGRDDSDQD